MKNKIHILTSLRIHVHDKEHTWMYLPTSFGRVWICAAATAERERGLMSYHTLRVGMNYQTKNFIYKIHTNVLVSLNPELYNFD